jgi:hypothetical protein
MAPVMIVGAARSGTTILYRSLQSHPRFMPAGGVNLVESHAMRYLPSLLRPEHVHAGPLANFTMGTDALAAVAEDIEHLALRRRIVRRLAGGSMSNVAIWKAAGEHHVVRRYFVEAHRRRGAQRLVEKTPAHLRWVPHLGAAFPRARFVFVLRHPVDVLSSFWKRARDDPKRAHWANITPDDFAVRWERTTTTALALSRSEPRFLLIHYEDFTRRTEETVRRVLDHVGEPFDPACLLTGELTPRDDAVPDVPDAPRRTAFKPLTETTKRWEDFLDPATASDLERRLAAAMARAGYSPRVHGVTGTS